MVWIVGVQGGIKEGNDRSLDIQVGVWGFKPIGLEFLLFLR